MDPQQREKFVAAYTKLLTSAWSDEAFAKRLSSNPTEVLKETGLSVKPGATIQIIRNVAGQGTLDDQVKLWEKGGQSGTYELYVPQTPQVQDAELSDEALAAVAGGSTSYCCCCSPCCTCT